MGEDHEPVIFVTPPEIERHLRQLYITDAIVTVFSLDREEKTEYMVLSTIRAACHVEWQRVAPFTLSVMI